MRFSNLKQFERHLARGAALALVAGLAAGCSSDVTRFQDGLFTGSVAPSSRQVASQPYPGDNLDHMSTGTVQGRAPRPQVPVGGTDALPPATPDAGAWSAPSVSRSEVQSAPLPAPGASRPGRSVLAPVASEPAPSRRAPRNLMPSRPAATAGGNPSGERQAGGTKLTIRQGETVYNLSRRFGVPAEAILAANDMASASELQAGQTIVIPTHAYSKSAPGSASGGNTNVASAQPLPGPAKPEEDRQTPMQPASDHLAVLPQAPKPREGEAGERNRESAASKAGTGSNIHTVVAGDTLYGISKQTGVSVARLKEANGLSDGYLRVGQKLKIPAAGEKASVEVADAGPKTKEVDPETTGTAEPAQKTETTQRQVRKVSTYTPPNDDGAAKENDAEQVASLPDTTGIGRLRWPVDGRVISSFGGNSGSPADDGIDIAVPDGTPIKAAENGVVIYAGDGLKEFGNTVLVRHEDGLVTVYGHASRLMVKRGDTVRRGQQIALSGMSGNADRPKVHFEVRKDSAPVDPMKYLN